MVVTAMESGTGTGAGTCTVEGVNTGQSDVVAMEMDVFSGEEVDSNPIPVARCRANTWHGRPILSVKEENSAEGAACGGKDGDLGPDGDAGADGVDTLGATEGSGGWRKGTTRRNAWGNLSYADLITKAIESAPEKRMTLSQIYGWMVQNISFFKDKGESNSSAGWKNSIRHNLSLHNRFMRVQNEGTGKSSWWMINPEAKTVKVPRRRAATMDTKTYSGKRGRAQRTVSLSTASSTTDLATKNEEFGEPRIEAAVFGSQDYRSGSTSGAGSLGGLSHMQAVEESEDVGDADFVSSSSMPMPWNSTYTTQENLDETLSESLADILVGSLSKEEMCSPENAPVAAIGQDATTLYPGASSTQCTFVTRDCPLTFPAASSHCPTFATHDNSSGKSIAARVNSQTFAQLPAFAGQQSAIGRLPDFGQQQQPDAVHLHFRNPVSPIDGSLRPPSFGNVFGNQTSELRQMNLRRLDDILRLRAASQKLYGQGELGIGQDVQTLGLAPSLGVGSHPILSPRLSPGSGATQRQLNSQLLLQLLASRPQLVAKMQHLLQTRQQQQHLLQQQLLNPSVQTVLAQSPTPSVSNRSGSMLQQLLVSSSTVDGIGTDAAAFHLNQIQSLAELSTSSMPSMSATSSVPPSNSSSPATSNFIPADLDLNFLDADAADIDCDIDQVIKHELTFGEKLDFSFDHTTDA